MADSGELLVLLKNLLENAVDHSPQGGTVRISLNRGGIRVEDEWVFRSNVTSDSGRT
jgi:signal transduction histidine kinase